MHYFLAKTDPGTYSIDDLEKDGETLWDGIHSYEAINAIKAMKTGDKVYLYHSGGASAIVGIAKVTSDPRQNMKDPRFSWVVDLAFEKKLKTPITLKEIKATGRFNDWKLIKQGRLSTMSVPDDVEAWLKTKL